MVTTGGEAITLTTLIYGSEDYMQHDKSEAIALAVDCMGLSDDAKADLYALLEESLAANMRFLKALLLVEKAIITNKRRFPRG